MTFAIDKAFAVPAAALKVQSQRLQLLSENIANADTPQYKARDVDFRAAMQQVGAPGAGGLRATDNQHLQPAGQGVGKPAVLYRVPANPSLDGNTVELDQAQSRFAETTVHYQAALSFLGSRINGLIGAIRGE
jgi:flagellar basal-body rod protein FlgB